jgi:peptide/nickel transport system substrate-binding protein
MEPRWGGTLVWAIRKDTETWNPMLEYGTSFWADDLFNRLVKYHINGTLYGDVCTHWDISSDFKEFTFYLREGVKWHDGKPFTSADVKWHYDTFWAMDPPNWQAAYFLMSEPLPIETPDDYTIKFTFNKPLNFEIFADMHKDQYIIPKHIYEGTDLSTNPANQMPIGTGPFKWVEYVKGVYYILEANEEYWGGRPYLDKVIVKFIPSPATAVLALKKGEIDATAESLFIPFEEFEDINAMPDKAAEGYPYTTTWRVAFNFLNTTVEKNPWIGEKKVRMALNHAIDRYTIVEELLNNITFIVDTPMTPPEIWSYKKDTIHYDYDPELAKQLMDEAGYPEGPGGVRFEFDMVTYDTAGDFAEAIKEYWRLVGVKCNIVLMDSSTFVSTIEMGRKGLEELQAGLHTMGTGANKVASFIHSDRAGIGGGNIGFYKNEEVDELLIEGLQEVDPVKRKIIYDEIQDLVVEDAGFVWLWNKWRTKGYDTDFKNWDSYKYPEALGLKSIWWVGGSETKPGEEEPEPEPPGPVVPVELEEKVADLETEIGVLKSTIGALESTVGGLETDIGDLETTISEIEVPEGLSSSYVMASIGISIIAIVVGIYAFMKKP